MYKRVENDYTHPVDRSLYYKYYYVEKVISYTTLKELEADLEKANSKRMKTYLKQRIRETKSMLESRKCKNGYIVPDIYSEECKSFDETDYYEVEDNYDENSFP